MAKRKTDGHLPWFMFHWRDWQASASLGLCSAEARDLWIELLCLMHVSPHRGRLLRPDGGTITIDDLPRLVRARERTAELLNELLRNGVGRVGANGAIESPYMLRSERLSRTRSNAGRKGGNPALRREDKQTDKQTVKPRDKQHLISDSDSDSLSPGRGGRALSESAPHADIPVRRSPARAREEGPPPMRDFTGIGEQIQAERERLAREREAARLKLTGTPTIGATGGDSR